MAIKNITLSRHYFRDQTARTLCAQLQEIPGINDMTILAAPLVEELDGRKGLFYTAWFYWKDVERVQEYFKELGYTIFLADERGKDKKLIAIIEQAETYGN